MRAERRAGGFRLRGRSFLFTYNWDFLHKDLPDGTKHPDTYEDLWRLWLAWKQNTKKAQQVVQSTSTLEQSLHSRDDDRAHFHWKVNLKEALDQETTVGWEFHGVKPDARATVVAAPPLGRQRARGASSVKLRLHGKFQT